jgi:hypothetical protein
MFPGVAKRFEQCTEWHKSKHKFKPLFGCFFNLCINGIFPNSGINCIHCCLHLDFKNIVGVCVLLVYQDPCEWPSLNSSQRLKHSILVAKPCNHQKISWLILWEAGVTIELPPWVMLAYPSSLLHHFNVDFPGKMQTLDLDKCYMLMLYPDFKFVLVDGDERPMQANSTPLTSEDGEGCGSFVFFNQASMYQSSKTGYNTLKDARIKGRHSGKTSYAAGLEQALSKFLVVYKNDN